jgi:parallel beta-helix repeat protein
MRQAYILLAAALLLGSDPNPAIGATCGEIISGPVTLTADLLCPTGHGLRLAAGAALDCAGHSISGAEQPEQYGIYLSAVSGASVRNCTVQRFEVGIRLRTATDCGLYDNIVVDNQRYGIEVTQDSLRALIWRNEISTNGDEGMHFSGPTGGNGGHQVLENVLDGNGLEGIYLLNAHGNAIVGNMLRNQGAAGIYVKTSHGNTIAENILTNDPIQLVAGSELNVLAGNGIVGQRMKFDGASGNHVYGGTIQAADGRPSNAYDFVSASGNRIVDAEAIDPVDYHIRATNASTGNSFVRFHALPSLRCFSDAGSSVTVTDPDGNPLACGVAPPTTTTTPSTTTTIPTSTTVVASTSTTIPSTTTTMPTSTTVASTSTTTTSSSPPTTTTAPPPSRTLELRVAASADDGEESASGSVRLSSSDLELVFDDSNQTVGMRFVNVDIPQGVSIRRAYVQFRVDETSSTVTQLTIYGEAADSSRTFSTGTRDLSLRALTTTAASWSPPAWTSTGSAGPDQRTPDIASLVREITQRVGWQRGNALSIIIKGSGERVAEAYDGDRLGAPLLHVEY